jgi:methylmalonyl-CoA mutase
MIRKDLKHIQLENQQEQDHTGISDAGVNTTEFVTAEGIELKQTYTKRYRESKTSRFWAGFAPNYVDRTYNVRSTTMDSKAICGFSTAEESNAFYRRNLGRTKKVYRLHLIYQRIEDTIQITNA